MSGPTPVTPGAVQFPQRDIKVLSSDGRTFDIYWYQWFTALVTNVNQNATGTTGSVTSVGLAAPVTLFTVSGSPVTGSGTLSFAANVQNANKVWAGPTTGADAVPTFRALVAADIPAGVGITAAQVQARISMGF